MGRHAGEGRSTEYTVLSTESFAKNTEHWVLCTRYWVLDDPAMVLTNQSSHRPNTKPVAFRPPAFLSLSSQSETNRRGLLLEDHGGFALFVEQVSNLLVYPAEIEVLKA